MPNEKLGEQPLVAYRSDLLVPLIDPTQPLGFRNKTIQVGNISGAGVTDGVKADVTVSGAGGVWTVNPTAPAVLAKLDKTFNTLSNVSVNTIPRLTKDHIAPLFDTAMALNRGWTMTQMKQWVHNIPHGLVGNGVTSDQSAFATYYGMLEDAVLNDTGSEARLLLPMAAPGGAFLLGSNALHPAISVIGPGGRGSVCLRAAANMGTTGPDAVRAMFYYIARSRDRYDSSATWIPTLTGLWLSGNKNNQSGNFVYGLYAETAVNDPVFAVTFTASLTAATSATLTAVLADGNGTYNFTFSTGAIKSVTVVGTACTWTGAVTATASAKYEGETIGYSSMHIYDCEIENFSGTGIYSSGKRRRLRMTNSRSLNHGLTSVPANRAHGIQFGGDAAVIVGCGFGGCSGNSVLAQFAPEPFLGSVNIWSPTASIRTDDQVGLFLDRCGGATISGGNLEDIIRIVGGQLRHEGINLTGIQFVPANAIFASDGVLEGTATICAALRVEDHKNVHVGNCNWSRSNDGFRYQYLVHATDEAYVKVEGMNTTDQDENSYKLDIKYEDDTSRVYWDHILAETEERQIDGEVVFPDTAQDLPSPAAGVGWLEIDASRGMQGCGSRSVATGNVSISPTAGYYRAIAASDHDSYTGAIWYLMTQQDTTSGAFDYGAVGYGRAIRVNATTLDIPIVPLATAPTSGVSLGKFWIVCQQVFTPKSFFVWLNTRLNGALRHVGCFSGGSTNPVGLIQTAHELAKLHAQEFQILKATLGTGNAVLKSMTDAISTQAMLNIYIPVVRTFLKYWTSRGKFVLFEGVPPNESSNNGTTQRYAAAIDNATQKVVEEEFRGKAYFLPGSRLLIDPTGTGLVNPLLADVGKGPHQNQAGADCLALAWAAVLKAVLPMQLTPPLPTCKYDRISEDGTNAMEGFWPGGGTINPNTIGAGALFTGGAGALMAEFTVGSMTGGGPSTAAFSIIDNPRDNGALAQAFRISFGGAHHMLLALTGTSGNTLLSHVTAGETWQGRGRITIMPEAIDVLDDWGVRMMGQVAGVSSVLCAPCTNESAFNDDNAPNPLTLHMVFKPFEIPASLTTLYVEFKFAGTATPGFTNVVISDMVFEKVPQTA